MNAVPNLIEWHFALYYALDQQRIRFVCSGNQFELLDKDGNRLCFGIDHAEGAGQVLMKDFISHQPIINTDGQPQK